MCNNHYCGCCHDHFEYCTPVYNLYSWNTKYPTYCATNTNSNVKPTSDMLERLSQVEQSLENKQDKLVSGTNIKTINGQAILGQGNIQISSGGGQGGSSITVTITSLSDGTKCINF